jgi:hypothetical protein
MMVKRYDQPTGALVISHPTRRPAPRRSVAVALGLALALVLATLGGTRPAGAAPLQADLKGLQGFDQAGGLGYHRIIWGLPAGTTGGPVTGWEVERWNAAETIKPQTYDVAYAQGPDLTVANMADEVVYKYRVRAENADGFGPWSGWEAVRVDTGLNHWFPFPSETALVRAHYQDFLGRLPSVGETSTATAQITNAAGVVTFINGLANRAARVQNRFPVIRLYLAYFDRSPDHGGLVYWVGRMNAGTASLQTVSSFFASSSEFKTMYQGLNNQQFVTLVYQNVLDRNPGPNEVAYWKADLDQGKTTRGKVMIGFSESAEGKKLRAGEATVADVYDAMIPTEPPSDALRLTYGAHILAGGTAGDLALFVQYLGDYQPG